MKVLLFLLLIFSIINELIAAPLVVIIDENGEMLSDVVGPVNEGSQLSLFCETNGGTPSVVTWWRGSSLLDDSFVAMPMGVLRNELTLSYLQRDDLMSTYTCQATSNVTVPLETSVSVDMNLKPLNVYITTLQRPLSAGRRTTLTCQSTGSRPPAILTWWIGSRQILNDTSATYDAVTISKLAYVPKAEDHRKVLSCRATNPVMNGVILEDHRVLEIYYVPQLLVTVGTPQSYILEGDDIYFDCNIEANPVVTEIKWRFDNQFVRTNIPEGIKVQNRSLLLRNINRNHSGNYSCVAANSEGEGESDNVAINVQFVPQCVPNQRLSYGVPLQESVEIKCMVEANPEDNIEFHWYLNGTVRQVPLQRFTVDRTKSTLIFTPKRKSDYGHIICRARNSVGFQRETCCFKVSPAATPDAVENCIVTNETTSSAIISCTPGFDGGLPQLFHLELYSSTKGLETSLSSKDTPDFDIEGLSSGMSFIALVFATNDRGQSNAVALTVMTKPVPKPESDARYVLISPVLAVLIAIIGMLVTIAVIVVLGSKHWSSRLGENVHETATAWEQGVLKPVQQYI